MMSFLLNFRTKTKSKYNPPPGNPRREIALTSIFRIFLRLPNEVLIGIFAHLANLSDVISLASTSHHLRIVYIENAKPIYHSVASRTFPFHKRARQVLADGGGPEIEQGLSLFYLATMFRNWHLVKVAMAQFERQMKLNMTSYTIEPIGPVSNPYHPPLLSRPEKRRFVRTYYTLWSLMRITPDLWKARLSRLSLRDLCYTHELCRLPQSIGGEEYRPSSAKRQLLRNTIWEHINEMHLALRGTKLRLSNSGLLFKEEEYFWFGCFWDHWQLTVRLVVCGFPEDKSYKMDLWDESDDDEPGA